MPTPKKFTFVTTGGAAGSVVDLGDWYSAVKITQRAANWIEFLPLAPGTAAPAAIVATPLPSANAGVANWVHMLANETQVASPDTTGALKYRYFRNWELGSSAEIIFEAQ